MIRAMNKNVLIIEDAQDETDKIFGEQKDAFVRGVIESATDMTFEKKDLVGLHVIFPRGNHSPLSYEGKVAYLIPAREIAGIIG